MSFQDAAATEPIEPDNTYPGRVFLFLAKPDETLAAGYDRIKVFRRKSAVDTTWVEVTTATTRLVITAGQYNYMWLDPAAQVGWQYRPSLADSTNVLPDVPQTSYVQDAVDTSYEHVITIQEMKDLYFYGLLGIFQDGDGVPFPDRLYAHYIQYGIRKFETKTRLFVRPTKLVEMQDFIPRDWDTYGTFQLDEFPVISVEKVELALPGADPIVFPADWVKLDRGSGVLHLVPTASNVPVMFKSVPLLHTKFLPQAVRISYTAGFELGKLPANLKDMIGKEAASGPLNIGGDLVGGAAIASQSMSVDGLSQSVNTTSSATNAGFGSRLIQYNNELKRDYPGVISYYKGPRLYVG